MLNLYSFARKLPSLSSRLFPLKKYRDIALMTHVPLMCQNLSTTSAQFNKKMISVTFINRDGVEKAVKAKVGDTFLDAAVNNDVDLEGFGACEGTLSCSTCHIIFKDEDFKNLPDKPSDEEMDMLDLAFGLTETSRLGCQVTLTENMDGIVVKVPAQVSDARGL